MDNRRNLHSSAMKKTTSQTQTLRDNQTQKSTPKQNEQLFLNGVWVSDKKININVSPPIALETST